MVPVRSPSPCPRPHPCGLGLQDKRNFLRDPPPGSRNFDFNYEAMYPVAMATLQEDDRLREMRFQLVPKQVTEEHFWRNYFYRVSLIRQSSELSAMAGEPGPRGGGTGRDRQGVGETTPRSTPRLPESLHEPASAADAQSADDAAAAAATVPATSATAAAAKPQTPAAGPDARAAKAVAAEEDEDEDEDEEELPDDDDGNYTEFDEERDGTAVLSLAGAPFSAAGRAMGSCRAPLPDDGGDHADVELAELDGEKGKGKKPTAAAAAAPAAEEEAAEADETAPAAASTDSPNVESEDDLVILSKKGGWDGASGAGQAVTPRSPAAWGSCAPQKSQRPGRPRRPRQRRPLPTTPRRTGRRS